VTREVVLVFVDYFLPGFKSGGPVRSVANLIRRAADSISFRVATLDRDFSDRQPYPRVIRNAWNETDGIPTFYYSRPSCRRIYQLIKEIKPDVVYLNSFLSRVTIRVLLLRKLGLIATKVVLAPRGELSKGALSIRPLRKRLYIALSTKLQLYSNILWHASSEAEAAEIVGVMQHACDTYVIAPDLLPPSTVNVRRIQHKKVGQASFVFVSRIAPKKNLLVALSLLRRIKGDISFDVYGPVDDAKYWDRCLREISELPSNVVVRYRGPIVHEEVASAFALSDFFLFPTLGENFGHVIIEALAAGCPPIISDTTYWTTLEERGIGWDLPLHDETKWIDVLQHCVDMTALEHDRLSENCRVFAEGIYSSTTETAKSIQMFKAAAHD
jgi:glycosyltransferase involved in cell wall biosynthesis